MENSLHQRIAELTKENAELVELLRTRAPNALSKLKAERQRRAEKPHDSTTHPADLADMTDQLRKALCP